MNIKSYAMAISAAIATASCGQITYPQPETDNTITDDYFGTIVADPYRPLENDTAEATTRWVEAENAVTNAYFEKIPFRNALRERLTELNNFKKTGLPFRENVLMH